MLVQTVTPCTRSTCPVRRLNRIAQVNGQCRAVSVWRRRYALAAMLVCVVTLAALTGCAPSTASHGYAPLLAATATPPLAGQQRLEVKDETGLDIIGSVSVLHSLAASTSDRRKSLFAVTVTLWNVGDTAVDYGPNSFYLLANHTVRIPAVAAPTSLSHPLAQGTLAPHAQMTGQIAFALAPDTASIRIVWVVMTVDGLDDSSLWVLRGGQ